MISIVEQIFKNGIQYSDKIAISNGKDSLKYKELLSSIIYSKGLLAEKYKLKKGDRVILSADKQIEFVFVYYACHLLEVVTIPIAPDTNLNRYELIKSKVSPKLIIGFPNSDSSVNNAELGEFKNGDLIDADNDHYPSLESIADIIFTTGTTGEPKGVQLSHKNISAAADNINTFIGNRKEDVELLALPISHSFGLGRMRCALANGQTLIMVGSFANVKRFFKFIKDYNVNGFGMVPASWALLRKFSGDEIAKFSSQLNYIEIGSAPMPIEEKEHLIKILPDTRICMHYGLTEASRSAFIEFHEEYNHLDTIGKQSPNMYITIRDEYGHEVPVDCEGEICVRGDAVMTGYLDIPLRDSFWKDSFRTGDWGLKDKDGYIQLKSRKKELINVGGKKVSPVEVEDVLKSIEIVDDCVCVGIEDPKGILGEVVKAFIVSSHKEKINYDNMEELIGDSLEGYKHPFEYELIDSIPKTSSGKIQRLLLKK